MSRPPESTRPSIDLSLTQVIAASAGAVVAAALAGMMRLSGTVLGAVLVTVVATVATAVVSLWLRRGRQRILTVRAAATPEVGGAAGSWAVDSAEHSAPPQAEPSLPRSAWSRPVLAGLVGGICAATLLAATGHPVLQVDASALDELQRWLRSVEQHLQSWAAGLG